MSTPARTHVARDPRSLITPEAFDVAPDLLGLPLATPGRRLAAILVDLAVIGVITLVTRSFGMVLGVLVAFLFIREGFKRTQVKASVFGRAMRLSVGCLGLWIGIITVILWASLGIGGGRDGDRPDGSDRPSLGLGGIEVPVETGAPWADERDAIIEGAMESVRPDTAALALATAEPGDSVPAAFTDPGMADTLRKLTRRIAGLEESSDAQQRAMDELAEELRREQEGGSVFSWLRNAVDELGFGFGWASLYLTVMLSWWKGQTVGKRLMKIRVLRLDGEPITWWTAFERAGGYAAGFATGLLGFAQVIWDANRQAIHDRIVGTVVVVDGAERVKDWEKAL